MRTWTKFPRRASDQSQCYPTIEIIARNVGCSSKSVERYIVKLAEKN
ncbi:helix-turn-helix domain-containing protein [Cohnella terricola]|nr:helix-turn-helix domain-containing protein [Cohnella terricola]